MGVLPLGLLDRAKKALQGRPAPSSSRVQYYRVPCGEGHILHGERTEGYQALRCPSCGGAIFVLPRSPLPEPIAPATPAAPAARPVPRPAQARRGDDEGLALADPPPASESARARSSFDPRSAPAAPTPRPSPSRPAPVAAPAADEPEVEEADIEWVDEPEPTPGPAPSDDPPPRPAPRKKPARPAAREPEPIPTGMVAVEDRPGVRDWVVRRRNPLIFAGVIALVAGTVAIRLHQRRLEAMPAIAEAGRVEGLARLDSGDFDVAKKILGDASAAVDALGGRVEGAEAIRQGAREAAILADLGRESLRELVEEAATYQPPDAWPGHFAALYRGRSVVLQAEVTAVPTEGAPSGYAIDYGIYYGRGSRPAGRGRVSLDGFRLIDSAKPRKGDQVTFGARLAGVRLDTASGDWLVELQPESGVFLTHFRALEALGWTPLIPPEEAPR